MIIKKAILFNKATFFLKRLHRKNCSVLISIFKILIFSNGITFGYETIDIAAIYALTGAAVENNSYSLEGIYYGVAEINSTGGVLGKKIKILEFDNQSTPIGSSLAATKATNSNAMAILGSAWSSHSLAVAKIAQKMEIPMISNVSTSPEVTKIGNYYSEFVSMMHTKEKFLLNLLSRI